jgi:hypothetical protein
MCQIQSTNIYKKIISSSKMKVLSNQHILSRTEFSDIQSRLINKFDEIDIRIIGDQVVLNIPNNLKLLISKKQVSGIKA